MIHREWGKRLRNTFEEIPPPVWNAHPDLSVSDETDQLVRPIIAQRRSNAVAAQPSTDVSAPESVQPIVIQTMA